MAQIAARLAERSRKLDKKGVGMSGFTPEALEQVPDETLAELPAFL